MARIEDCDCCLKCGITRPGKYAMDHIQKTWYQYVCRYCQSGATGHGLTYDTPSSDDALSGLRNRAMSELGETATYLQDVRKYKQREKPKGIRTLAIALAEKKRNILKHKSKPTVAVCLAGQLVRARNMLTCYGDHRECIDAFNAALLLMGFE